MPPSRGSGCIELLERNGPLSLSNKWASRLAWRKAWSSGSWLFIAGAIHWPATSARFLNHKVGLF